MSTLEDIYNTKEIKERLSKSEYNISKMVKTDDCWYPNYPNDEIKVSMYLLKDYDGAPYVTIDAWGMDDTGVKMEYCQPDTPDGYYYADKVWNLWKEHIYDKIPEVVDKNWFFDRGFLWV